MKRKLLAILMQLCIAVQYGTPDEINAALAKAKEVLGDAY